MAGLGDFRVSINAAQVSVFSDELGEEISRIIGPVLVRAARGRAPVRSGVLRDSIAWEHIPGPGGGETRLSAIWYDIFLERPARQIKTPRRTLIDTLKEDVPRLIL